MWLHTEESHGSFQVESKRIQWRCHHDGTELDADHSQRDREPKQMRTKIAKARSKPARNECFMTRDETSSLNRYEYECCH